MNMPTSLAPELAAILLAVGALLATSAGFVGALQALSRRTTPRDAMLPLARTAWPSRVAALLLLLALSACASPSSVPGAGSASSAAPAAVGAGAGVANAPAAAQAAPAPPPAPRPLRVAYSAVSATQATYFIAQAAGLYTKHGLDVNLQFVEANNSVAALLANEVDIASAGADLVAGAVANGSDLVILATPLNTYPQMLAVTPDITTAEQLRGKRVGVSRFGAVTDAAGRAGLAHLGLRPTDVEMVQTGSEGALLTAMQNGAIQAAVITPPADGVARRAGFRILLDISTLNLPQPAAPVGTTRRFATAEPDTVERFLRAYLEAVKLYKTDRASAAKWFGEFARTEDAESIGDNLDWVERTLPRLPLPTVEGMQSVIDRLGPENPAIATLRATDLIDASFLQRIEASGFLRQLWGE